MGLLEHITVLDLTRDLAGSLSAMRLGDLGARVIKLEPAEGCDFSKENPAAFAGANREKERVSLDIFEEEGRKRFLELIKDADVVLESFRPGTLEELDCGYEKLRELQPKLVLTSVTAYGQTGPLAGSWGTDESAIQAISGAMTVTGDYGGTPLRTGYAMADFLASAFGAAGTVAALLYAAEHGEGKHVDVAKLDSMVLGLEQTFTQHHMTGKMPVPRGNEHPTCVPSGDYTTRDDRSILVNISNDDQFAKLCGVLGHPEILDTDLKYKAIRGQNRDQVNQHLGEWFGGRMADELCEALYEEGLAYGEANTIQQVTEHPQIQAREAIGVLDCPEGRKLMTAVRPYQISGETRQTKFRLHAPGEDTESVLREMTGGSEECLGGNKGCLEEKEGYPEESRVCLAGKE